MNELDLENVYREHLEEDIIFCLKGRKNISFEEAMHLYYTSKLSEKIHSGEYGIQYLDYTILTDLLEDEIKM